MKVVKGLEFVSRISEGPGDLTFIPRHEIGS